MFSVTGAVGELAELLDAVDACEDVVDVTLGLITGFLLLPARRRGLSNR
jgi:hypothetical protein